MPELLLLRHGKSSWDDAAGGDRDRPLAPRGRRDAEAMAALIARKYPPDRVLCSPAKRTRETLGCLGSAVGDDVPVEFIDALYDNPGDYTDAIGALGGEAERLLVVGHNPAIQATSLALIGSGDAAARTRLHVKFPTGALAVIRFDRLWAKIEPLSGQLVAFHRPREHRNR